MSPLLSPTRLPLEFSVQLGAGLDRARSLGHSVLVCTGEQLRDSPDLLELFSAAEQRRETRFFAALPEEELEILGLGSACEIAADGSQTFDQVADWARTWLADAIVGSREGQPGPLFVGGLAFEPRLREDRGRGWQAFGGARFTLPELLIFRRGAEAWLMRATRVLPEVSLKNLAERCVSRWSALLAKPRATRRELRPAEPEHEQRSFQKSYLESAAEILAAIRRGEAQKVVLAVRDERQLRGDLLLASALRSLVAAQPRCLTFAQGLGDQTFLGASPERLVRSKGPHVEAVALAGTVGRGNSRAARLRLARQLQSSPKERREHDFVVRAVASSLRGFCDRVEAADQPGLLDTGTVQHLYTLVRGELRSARHILEIADRLHPTPALAGTPRSAALQLIGRFEDFDRGWYGGPVGWFDSAGQGDLFVALRCGLVSGGRVALFAGSGLVAESDPSHEAAETSLKLQSLGDVLRRA